MGWKHLLHFSTNQTLNKWHVNMKGAFKLVCAPSGARRGWGSIRTAGPQRKKQKTEKKHKKPKSKVRERDENHAVVEEDKDGMKVAEETK